MAKTDLVANGEVLANIIQLNPVGTFTNHIQEKLEVKDHIVQWQKAGLALIMVQDRYSGDGHYSLGFVDRGILQQRVIK